MKAIILNASPRKNKNTATLLHEAENGAKEAGAETEYINLVELNYKGCMSCFACKLKNNKCLGICAFKDELRPVLEKIHSADALIVGSPIYYSNPTGMFRNLIERLFFPVLRYDSDGHGGAMKYIEKKLNVGLIYTMNVTEEMYEKFNYKPILEPDRNMMEYYFGHCEVLNSHNTWQFPDYSKYDSSAIDLKSKEWYRDNQFPKDKISAFEMGKRLVEKIK